MHAAFFKELFDLWHADALRGEFIYIRHFENLLNMARGYPPEHCGMSGCCGIQYVVEADGTVYPCDFYATGGYELGSLSQQGFEENDENRARSGFIDASIATHASCAACEYRALCGGGCRRDRDAGAGALGLNYYCGAYKSFFAHAIPGLNELLGSRRAL
jgi:uncharacterized protein